MAIIPTTQTTVARYAAGLYGVKLGNLTNQAVLQDITSTSGGGISGLNAALNTYYAPFSLMTSAQVAAIVVANAGIVAGRYGLTADNVNDAVAFVTAELNTAAPTGNQGVAIANVLAGWSTWATNPVFGQAASAFNLKIAQAVGYANSPNTPDVAFGEINTVFRLTGGGENRTGTAGDDTFIGTLGTLDNADRIEGGGGFDTLQVQVQGVVAPNISNVEHLSFQAQFNSQDGADNNLGDTGITKVDFNTGLTTKVSGFTTIENNNSRTDLIVEDVRIADNQITKDITIIMRETDPGNVDYGVYFDQNSLRNVSSSASQINLRVLDTYAVSQGLAPLKDSPYGSFTFSYSLNGAAVQTVTLASQAMQDAQTFPEMVAAMQAAADAIFGAGTVTVALGSTYTVPDSVTAANVQGTEIVLSAQGNIVFSTPAGSGWLATDVVPPISGLHTSFTVGGTTATELVTSNIILDDVGRGSTGGDLVVGGLSVGETSTSKGVQKFLIEVQDNSKLQTINSTNNTLREVVLVNGTTTRVDNAYNENQLNAGSLTVRGYELPNNAAPGTGNNNTLPGADTATGAGINHGSYGFTDVRVIDGSAMTGKFDFDAQITSRSIAKYLDLKDTAANPAADNVAFTYSGGSNNDVISATIDGAVVGATNTLTGREDYSFTANGGAGNDQIMVQIDGNSANWLADQQGFRNVTLNGGEGNDTIRKIGNGNTRIDAGTGNDTVYADNSGLQSLVDGALTTTGSAATWVINATNTAVSDLLGAGNGRHFLYNGKLTMTFSAPTSAVTVTDGAADAVAANYTNGWEVTVNIPTGANYAVTQAHLNQAIKDAIVNDAVLNKVLTVADGPANTLVITSLIDGTFDATDIAFNVTAPDVTTLPAGEQATVLNAFKLFSANSAALIADAQIAQAAAIVAKQGTPGVNVPVLGTAIEGLNVVVSAPTTQGAAAVAETFTVDLAGSTAVAGDTYDFDGVSTAALAGGETAAQIALALFAAGATANWTPVSLAGSVITYTATVPGVIADVVPGDFTVTGAGVPAAAVAVTTQGAAAVAEVFNATFSGVGAVGQTITFDGVVHNVAGLTGADVAALIDGAADGAGWTDAAAGGNVVTFTSTAPGVLVDVVTADFINTGAPAALNGANSSAHSDNLIALGAGDDVVVLGTGALSNDTLVYAGYNQGKDTIINFSDAGTNIDRIDYTSYLNGKFSLSGSVESQQRIATTLNADAVTEANSVTVINGAFDTTTNKWSDMSAAKLLAAINSTNTGAATFAGINAGTLDALTTYVGSGVGTTLVGGIGKAVVMVQNNLNEGEYAVFELTFNGLATNTTADFSAAELIGVLDFGNTLAPTLPLFA